MFGNGNKDKERMEGGVVYPKESIDRKFVMSKGGPVTYGLYSQMTSQHYNWSPIETIIKKNNFSL